MISVLEQTSWNFCLRQESKKPQRSCADWLTDWLIEPDFILFHIATLVDLQQMGYETSRRSSGVCPWDPGKVGPVFALHPHVLFRAILSHTGTEY